MKKITKRLLVHSNSKNSFRKFVNELNDWWPGEYTWSQKKPEEIKIDGRLGGLCTEIGPHGFRCDWGRVTEFESGERIAMKWQISMKREPVPDPDKASDIEVSFIERGGETEIVFSHSNFENHGEGWEEYLEAMDGEYGWDYILKRFKNFCNN